MSGSSDTERRPSEAEALKEINRQIYWHHRKWHRHINPLHRKKKPPTKRAQPEVVRRKLYYTVPEMMDLCGYTNRAAFQARLYSPTHPFPIRPVLVRLQNKRAAETAWPRKRVAAYFERVARGEVKDTASSRKKRGLGKSHTGY